MGQETTQPTLVLGIDFTAAGRAATDAAARLAHALGARIVAVHAFSPELPPTIMTTGGGAMSGYQSAWDMSDAIALTTQWVEGLRADGLDTDPLTGDGPAARLLLETARDVDAGYIIVGTRSRGGLARLVMGSVAQEVIRKSDRPVIVIPERGAAEN